MVRLAVRRRRSLFYVDVVQHGYLPEFVAASLAAHAAPLARHWLERAAAATPRPASTESGDPADGDPTAVMESAERVVRALAASVRSSTAAALVRAGEHAAARRVLGQDATALDAAVGTTVVGTNGWDDGPPDLATASPDAGGVEAAATRHDARPTADVMRLGWAAGGAAYAAGHSVHHVVRDADLLLAIVLADVERAVAERGSELGGGPADGLAVARQLQRAATRYTQAAVSGFVHALLRGLRDRYRLLRHDLRNPLGTIRSALSLMEDETVPVETRQGPNIRAMVARNAGSLDRLIGRRLDDASAVALLAPTHTVHVRDVALAARREVRDAARLAGCDVLVDVSGDVPSQVDGAALELTLTTLLLAALAHAPAGGRVRVRCVDRPAGAAPVVEAAAAEPVPTSAADGAEVLVPCAVLRVDLERADGGVPCRDDPLAEALAVPSPARVPCWDEQGLELALALAQDHGGRLGGDAEVEPVRDAAALVTALARSPTVYVRLPLIESGATPVGGGALDVGAGSVRAGGGTGAVPPDRSAGR